MHKPLQAALTAIAATLLVACSATQNTSSSEIASNQGSTMEVTQPTTIRQSPPSVIQGELTLEQIMADPDWIGREPSSPFWSVDGSRLYYQQKREGSKLTDLWQVQIDTPQEAEKVPLEELHNHKIDNRVYNQDKSQWAWIFEGNLFTASKARPQVQQLTRDNQSVSRIQFLTDGRISYQQGNSLYGIEPTTGRTELIAHWKFEESPEALTKPKDYIAEQQLQLIDVLASRRADKQAQFEQRQSLRKANNSMVAEPVYLTPKFELVEASLSPNGQFLILVEQESRASRSDTDIMPNYIMDDGRIAAQPVRQRVADAKPENHQIWFVDLQSGEKRALSFNSLPGYNEDVLAAEKAENAKAKGQTYTTNRLPRDITLMFDWYWSQSAIQWSKDGEQVAIMLEAWDNKDRWIATVDKNKGTLVSQHRLHDDAWVNYKFNSFGWLNRANTLYFLSEESGYAHLYTKALNGKAQQITKGQFVVDELTLSADDRYMYFQANIKHPGIYEIYRVDLTSKDVQALTDLNGMTEYQLSDDEQMLLLTHSKLTAPPELYLAKVGDPQTAKQITDSTTEAFKQIQWQAPDIVPVKSSNTVAPIYSRVYLPANGQQDEKRRAVIFSHGAGYLQNAHLGWSSYFREFMFHNLLAQKGYVVMDMDYRASQGYGRDWRTAIYRHMGKPEIEDLRDGVNWLVDNANVDRQRIGTYGGSYGGFMTFMALFTAPDLFQAGAALRPVSDWAHYNHGYTSNILNHPDVDPIAYERSSPIYFAEGLEKPLLINAPMVDSNVFFVDVVRLVQRLIELEKQDFETAIYPVESHGFVEPSSWLDEYRRIFKLFEENL